MYYLLPRQGLKFSQAHMPPYRRSPTCARLSTLTFTMLCSYCTAPCSRSHQSLVSLLSRDSLSPSKVKFWSCGLKTSCSLKSRARNSRIVSRPEFRRRC
ncbi:hypothetical protein FA95DRAFT_507255 [Auriscalpium vulgare]|uniref:Uncharacterized protein n=1 Tax=Auriscalpium vulgare TaxID=40419 RepID=A0ACB8RG29_9AGAM|nr:hypothetical protein FA95DRAFT_507255 [Auriscalpium vulgare]